LKEAPKKLETELAESPLWDPSLRDASTFDRVPDHVINARRSSLLVPGAQLPLTDEESRIPALLIRCPKGHQETAFGAGWDLILPAGWGENLKLQ